MKAGDGLKAVDSDLCQWLLKSHGFQVDFLVDRDRLWHLTPRLSEDADHHTSMKSLQQLLGDDVLMAEISTYTPKEKLILCYILANSLLFFYPGTWLKSSWGSDKVYFLPQVNSSKPLILTMPYLSVDLHQAHTRQRSLRDHMQVHSHPVILDLGIIFLEIATGIKFVSKSHHSVENEWEQCNSDVRQAWQQFQDLEKLSEYDSSKRISPTLRKVISSCIKLEPPPNFPCNSLSEEGPIRQYILSCIVQPLASELKDGHQVRLENLHLPLSPEKGTEKLSVSSMQHLTASCRPTASQSLTPSRELPKQHTIATVTCPIRRDEFEIAVVCALPLEYDAVTLAFDEFWEDEGDRYGKAPGDPNTYTTGRIGQYNVVLALLPNMGKVRAASATASLRSSYAGLRLALLTGICGGVPGSDPENEIILGDVIISKTIIQYDFGRRYPDGFVPKDTRDDNLGRSNTDIRSFVSKFETSHGNKLLRYKASRVLAHIQEKAVKKQDRVRYGRPVASEDKLFKPGYLHKHRGQSEDRCCESACQAAQAASCDELCCDPAQLVARKRLRQIQELERNGMLSDSKVFEIHVGCMGSGDTVMKSGEDRDMIAKKYGIMAFEMEGAGVWDEVPCIIVKGVCDYADCHKNKKWQAYAAATAASVMKALLAYYGRTDKPAG
ncbi:nucleoside phosphorylase domain-containing protein [Colletotrichum cereale]|nr:nucleoside phosphorylase domain-containing protein [Colletotrichum cereale]